MFRALVADAAGGGEWERPTWLRVIEVLAGLDGAVGWNSGIGASATALLSGWVAEDVARNLLRRSQRCARRSGGALRIGPARRRGYILSGRCIGARARSPADPLAISASAITAPEIMSS